MAASERKDSWKLTSNSHKGRASNIRKAAASREFIVSSRSDCREANARKEHIVTERTTGEARPVKKANAHKASTMPNISGTCSQRHCLHKGRRRNTKRTYRKPMCNPDNDSTCIAPETE